MTRTRRSLKRQQLSRTAPWTLLAAAVILVLFIYAFSMPPRLGRRAQDQLVVEYLENHVFNEDSSGMKDEDHTRDQQPDLKPEKRDVSNEEKELKVKERARAAMLGAFVADAATMGLHWIYDTAEIRRLIQAKNVEDSPEFFEPPSGPFYKYPSGSLSPYGDEALALLESMAEEGGIDPEKLSQHMYKRFKEYTGRLNSASIEFIKNIDNGKEFPAAGALNNEAHGLIKVPLVVGRYAGLAQINEKILDAIKVHQNDPSANDSGVGAALILERVILGDSIRDAVAWAIQSDLVPETVREWLNPTVPDANMVSIKEAIAGFGQSCHLPGSFQGPMFVGQHSESYQAAIRDNMVAGGDNCSRAHLIGALFAAQDGLKAIPDSWQKKMLMYTDIEALVDDLLERRSGR